MGKDKPSQPKVGGAPTPAANAKPAVAPAAPAAKGGKKK
jgi:hypothetical protein